MWKLREEVERGARVEVETQEKQERCEEWHDCEKDRVDEVIEGWRCVEEKRRRRGRRNGRCDMQ